MRWELLCISPESLVLTGTRLYRLHPRAVVKRRRHHFHNTHPCKRVARVLIARNSDSWNFPTHFNSETGTPVTSTCVGLGNTTNVPEEATGLPVPGWDGNLRGSRLSIPDRFCARSLRVFLCVAVKVLLDDGLEAAPGQLGNVAIRRAFPLCASYSGSSSL